MKIVQILAGKIWGGAEQYAIDLGRELSRQGHEVYYFACKVPVVEKSIPSDVHPIYLNFKGAFDVTSAQKIAQFLTDNPDVDVIHIHGTNFVTVTTWAKRLSHSKAKIVLTRHTSRATFINPLFWWAFRRLHRIIFVSGLSQRLWLSVNRWMNKEKCLTILNSIPDSKETQGEEISLTTKYALSNQTKILLFIGRLVKYKGCEVAIKALGRLSEQDFKLIFIGKGKDSYIEYLKQLAQQNGIGDKVEFFGFSNKVRSLVKQAYIGILPSIIREGCPLVPLEFMKAGKFVITTNNGGQAECIQDGENGILIAPNDVIALKDALTRVLNDTTLVDKISQQAKTSFECHLNYSVFINNVIACYQS